MGKSKKEFGLGRGLSSLIPTNIDENDDGRRTTEKTTLLSKDLPFDEIDISKISFNPLQPRKEFDENQLEELTNSIKENGVIQPITVRKTDFGFQLISGERRTRAALKAGLKTIPAFIINVEGDNRVLELALIENIQREDINPIDLANAFKKLIEEFNYTQEELARKIGKDRSTITNILRLLKLPLQVQDSLKKDEITLGHAKVLLAISSPEELIRIWQKVVKEKLSVRQTESIINSFKNKKLLNTYKKTTKDENVLAIEKELVQTLGTNVTIVHKDTKGKIIIEFYNNEDFQRIIELILTHRDF